MSVLWTSRADSIQVDDAVGVVVVGEGGEEEQEQERVAPVGDVDDEDSVLSSCEEVYKRLGKAGQGRAAEVTWDLSDDEEGEEDGPLPKGSPRPVQGQHTEAEGPRLQVGRWWIFSNACPPNAGAVRVGPKGPPVDAR